MRPQTDDYATQIAASVRAILADGIDAGRRALEPMAYPPRAITRRPALRRSLLCAVYWRDHFTCRYCACETILPPVMELLGSLYPDNVPFESDHWPGGRTHPAFEARCPAVDHIAPGALGGAWLDPDNLATACNVCNAIKANFTLSQLGWQLNRPTTSSWDGLAADYEPLWRIAGAPNATRHKSWMRDINAGKAVARSWVTAPQA